MPIRVRLFKELVLRNVFTLVGGIFAAVGSLLLVASAVLLYRDSSFAAEAEMAEGRVLTLERNVSRERRDGGTSTSITYTAIIEYTDQGGQRHEMAETISSNPPRLSIGQEVRVLYDPANPASAVVDDFWGRKGAVTIVGFLAVIFTILGGTLLAVNVRHRRRRAHILAVGVPVEASFLEVVSDTGQSRNGQHPYRVIAQGPHPRTGKLRRYESDAIWVDPTAQLQGRPLRVLVDPQDPDKYHIDLSDIIDDDGGA